MLFSLVPFISFNAAECLDFFFLEEIKASHYYQTLLCSFVFKSEQGEYVVLLHMA